MHDRSPVQDIAYITLNKDIIFPETGKLTQALDLRRNKMRFNFLVVEF